jgi:adenosine deaminase
VNLPKGGDLHNHLAGAVYAESWIRAGGEDDLCVDLATLSFVKTQTMTRSNPPQPVCGEGNVAAATAQQNQKLYTALVNAFSIRSFVPSSGVSAHDHFFDAFQRFFGTDPRHTGEWLNEVATRAAAQNEQYLELMETPAFDHTAAIAKELGWNENLAQFRDALLAHGLRDDIGPARAHFDQAESNRRKMEHCDEPAATAACQVTIRFLYQVLRGFPKEQVFAQTLLGFEVASADPLVVGINFVMPEDAYIPMRDYAEQMKMVAFLHSLYPKVHISLHAGELAPGLVPPEGLCCHIRMAVEVAHAERIGHGVDLMYEEKPHQLLREMATKHVMVEINLTSNDWILGIRGKHHPLPIYRQFQVPVALSTDDEGVSRIDVTHEYQRAVEDFALRYADLKRMARTSIEHSFLPGRSLWAEADQFGKTASECASDTPGAKNPSTGCAAFLKSSEKAAEQWELERRYSEFETQF